MKKEYEFKNGERYGIEEAGRDGVLVFKDAIFKASFDEDWSNDYGKSSIKEKLEKWWDEYAPDELREAYDVSLLSAEEVYSQEELDEWHRGLKSTQLPLFANDWKARIKRIKGKRTSCWWWLRTPYPSYSGNVASCYTDGSLNSDYANLTNGCVPACYPKKLTNSLEPGSSSGGKEGE